MRIVTDCAADMPAEELEALAITQAPLYIQFPEGEVNSADITADAFYDRLEAMRPQIPTTAQPSTGTFAQIYRQLAAEDPDILSIHVSSGLSGTLNSATGGAQEAAPQASVTVWDSLTLSGGQRFQVLAAAHAIRSGWALPAIQERLSQIRAATEVIYTLETLEYLARGGRIGRVQALAGKLLHIKPVIHVNHTDGKYDTVTKSRTLSGSLNAIADHLHALFTDQPVWITVLHGRIAPQAANLSDLLNTRLNVAKNEVMRISPVLGVHTGPGIVGTAVMPMSLIEDLLL